MTSNSQPGDDAIERLQTRAGILGATGVAVIAAAELVVEDRFAAMCAEPHRCPSYGLAPGCPPHAMLPTEFRRMLRGFRQALVFKIDAPLADLQTDKRKDIARCIHVIAATLEHEAIQCGFACAHGIAAGSCKELFCGDQESCRFLHRKQPCPHADQARPSLSALGINFALLAATADWPFSKPGEQGMPSQEPVMAMMAGLVLLA